MMVGVSIILNNLRVSAMLWSGKIVYESIRERECENPVMTFPIKKRINTELFIDRAAAALYIRETWDH